MNFLSLGIRNGLFISQARVIAEVGSECRGEIVLNKVELWY